MKGNRLFLKTIALILIMCVPVTLFCSCKAEKESFPELSYNTEESVEETADPSIVPDNTNDIVSLNVALPYSSATVELLARLYYAKNNDMLPDDSSGADINLDYLNAIDIPWVIDSVQLSSTGADSITIGEWTTSGSVPDIFLANNIEDAYSSGAVTALDDYLYDRNISTNGMYLSAFNECVTDGSLYGIPHYASVMLLYGNSDYIPEDYRIAYRATTGELRDYLTDISEAYEGVVPLVRGYELIPFITEAFTSEDRASYMFSEEYLTDPAKASSDAVSDAAYVRDLYESGLSSDSDEEGSDPRITRNAAVWVDSSAAVSVWNEYYPGNIYYVQLPTDSNDDPAVPMVSVYPLCVSEDCSAKDMASDFALFLCSDPDALMLIYRLEPQVGFLPIVTNTSVWDVVISEELFGAEAMMYEQIMDNMICYHASQQVSEYCSEYIENTGTEEEFEFDLGECLG